MNRPAPKRATRRRAHAERAAYIDKLTDNCAMSVDYFFALANDPEADVKDRSDAHKWLTEHSTGGKPPSTTEVDVHVTGDASPMALDYSRLSLEDALLWRELHRKATAKALPPAEAVDNPVESVDAEIVAETPAAE